MLTSPLYSVVIGKSGHGKIEYFTYFSVILPIAVNWYFTGILRNLPDFTYFTDVLYVLLTYFTRASKLEVYYSTGKNNFEMLQ